MVVSTSIQPPGKRPQAGVFLHQQYAAFLDDGGPRVDLGRLIARLAEEHVAHGPHRQAAAAREHFRRQFAQAPEAFDVVGILE